MDEPRPTYWETQAKWKAAGPVWFRLHEMWECLVAVVMIITCYVVIGLAAVAFLGGLVIWAGVLARISAWGLGAWGW